MNPRFLCHKEYRTTVPLMRIIPTLLFLLAVYPVALPELSFAAVIVWWSIRQWCFARATWSLEGSRLRNTLMGKSRELDLEESSCVSRAQVQCIHVKHHRGYAQMQFYAFSRLPSGFRPGLIGYGGPGAIRRMIENGLFLLPVTDETTELIRRRYPDGAIPEFPEYVCLKM